MSPGSFSVHLVIICACLNGAKATEGLHEYVDQVVRRLSKRSTEQNKTFIPTTLGDTIIDKFAKKYGPIFGDDLIHHRREIILANVYAFLLQAAKAKSENRSYVTTLNEMALFDRNESKQLRGFNPSLQNKTLTSPFLKSPPAFVRGQAPAAWDWREHSVIGPVLNQGTCGTCYSFAALKANYAIRAAFRRVFSKQFGEGVLIVLGATPGFTANRVVNALNTLKTGRREVFSPQQINDCSKSFGNKGCTGGTMENAYAYIISNGGLTTFESYPYVAQDQPCKGARSVFTIDGYSVVPKGDENELQYALLSTPIAVGIDASHDDFLYYSGGIYDNPACSSTKLDHAVLLVGYGQMTLNGMLQKYWILQNSWGDKWGEAGYFKLPRFRNNFCGVATQASYGLKEGVVVSGAAPGNASEAKVQQTSSEQTEVPPTSSEHTSAASTSSEHTSAASTSSEHTSAASTSSEQTEVPPTSSEQTSGTPAPSEEHQYR